MSATAALATYVAENELDDISADVQREAKRALLNYLGCALGGSIEPALEVAIATLAPYSGKPSAVVLGRRERFDALHAALLNGIGSHVHEYDDTLPKNYIHPSVPVASALFAYASAHPVSGRDLILILGGLFLLWKSTHEIHDKLEGEDGHASTRVAPTFTGVIIQILLLDIVFSLDSVITAVGMAKYLGVMIAAVIIALIFMLIFAGRISDFIHKHPSLKMLALSFLLLIGTTLIIEGLHAHIPKGYIYFAMAFSVFVEILNIRLRRHELAPVRLHSPYVAEATPRTSGGPARAGGAAPAPRGRGRRRHRR